LTERQVTPALVVAGALLLAGPALLAGAWAQDGLGPPAAARERGVVLTAPSTWRAARPIEPERAAWVVRPEGGGGRVRVSLVRLRPPRPLDEHVARWASAFQGDDGRPLPPAAATREVVKAAAGDLQGTLVLLRGALVGPTEPGEEPRPPRSGWAALYAVIDGPDGTWVASAVGPAAAVLACRDGLRSLLAGARVGLVEPDPPPPPSSPAPAPGGDDETPEGE
jgi:hypothetical protein